LTAPFFCYQLADALSGFLPKEALSAAARIFSRIYTAIFIKEFESAALNLQAAFGGTLSQKALRGKIAEMVSNFSVSFVELFYSKRLTEDSIRKSVETASLAILDDTLKKKRGVILASAHLGHWELGGMVLARLGYPLYGMALKHTDPKIETVFGRLRKRGGVNVVLLGQTPRECYRVLRENKILGIVADRLFGSGKGIEVEFMGRRVHFPDGIARLSLSTGAPVVPVFFIKTANERYKMELENPIEADNEAGIVQRFAAILEEKIKKYPTQWFIFQPFWEKPRWP